MNPYPWQQPAFEKLQKQHQQNRLPHALLFHGPSGVGKQHFSHCVAKALLCSMPSVHGWACGQCRCCQLFAAQSHPDFYPVVPLEKSKSIKVDQIRALTHDLVQTAQCGGRQVAVIYPADAMNRACSNALLKTLEEPVGSVVLMLVADQLGSIPATILSRCQKIYFETPSVALTLPWLCATLPMGALEAKSLLQLSRGSPLGAIAMAESHYRALRDEVLRALWRLLQEPLWVGEVTGQLLQWDGSIVLQAIFSIALDVLRVQFRLSVDRLDNQDQLDLLQKMGERLDVMRLSSQLPLLLQAKGRLQTVSGLNVGLLMEGVLLRWQSLGKGYVS